MQEITERCIRDSNVTAVFLGGSFARGDTNAYSDFDIFCIGKKQRFVRYHHRGTTIEISVDRLSDVSKRLRADPAMVYVFHELRPLWDPHAVLPNVRKIVARFATSHPPTARVRGDLFLQLDDALRKIQGAVLTRNTKKARFIVARTLPKMLDALFVVNGKIAPPATHTFQHVHQLKILPPRFPSLWNRLLDARRVREVDAAQAVLNFLLGKLRSAMLHFPRYYKPWKANTRSPAPHGSARGRER